MKKLSLLLVEGAFFFCFIFSYTSCSLTTPRPHQELFIADMALKAAKDVNGDIIENSKAPELFRKASEHFSIARREYKLKNFDQAKIHALKSIHWAELAEFEAIKSGGATPEAQALRKNTLKEGAPAHIDLETQSLAESTNQQQIIVEQPLISGGRSPASLPPTTQLSTPDNLLDEDNRQGGPKTINPSSSPAPLDGSLSSLPSTRNVAPSPLSTVNSIQLIQQPSPGAGPQTESPLEETSSPAPTITTPSETPTTTPMNPRPGALTTPSTYE